MPSLLRHQLDIQSTQSYFPHKAFFPPPSPKTKMSLSQTYRVASTARSKLGMEAGRPDHNLRLLVGHANLLDSLMVDLADAEREQESWFNSTIRSNNHGQAPKHIQWFDNIVEENDDVYDDDSSDSDSDYDEEETVAQQRRRSVSPPPPARMDIDEYDDEDDEFEDFDSASHELALHRVASHPPELVHGDSDSEEEESMPPSPTNNPIPFNEKSKARLDTRDAELVNKAIAQLQSEPHILGETNLQTTSSAPHMISAY